MLLSVDNLRVSYGNIKALHGINFHIDEGEIVCIIGANGAGKSTTLRAISRLIPVEKGTSITYMGEDLLEYSADKVVSELGISHVPEGRRLFGNLTVMENLNLATFYRKHKQKNSQDVERVFAIFPPLSITKTPIVIFSLARVSPIFDCSAGSRLIIPLSSKAVKPASAIN